MAFSSTKIHVRLPIGNRKLVYGSWTSPNATGGNISTGLKRVDICVISHKGSSVTADSAVINETFPLAGGDVTIVCTSGDSGYYIAIGI